MVETKTDVKVKAFRALHRGPPFVMPNPWDVGSARVLAGLGFRALATTSSGFAFSRGRRDGAMSFSEVLDHIRELTRATPLPVSADLENGYGPAPQAAARAVTRAAEAGAVGGSVEDWDMERGIYPLERAVERVGDVSNRTVRRRRDARVARSGGAGGWDGADAHRAARRVGCGVLQSLPTLAPAPVGPLPFPRVQQVAWQLQEVGARVNQADAKQVIPGPEGHPWLIVAGAPSRPRGSAPLSGSTAHRWLRRTGT